MTMQTNARSIGAMALAAALSGCTPRAEARERDVPPPPSLGVQIERAGRPLIGNALLGPLASGAVSARRKEEYNRAAPSDWPQFAPDIARSLGLYDGFDRKRGNQWLSDPSAGGDARYAALAKLFADDRLWINSESTVCTRFLAVELSALARQPLPNGDCGGRTPVYDAVDVFRSLLMNGTESGLEDGVARDDRVHSTTEFPFLAAP